MSDTHSHRSPFFRWESVMKRAAVEKARDRELAMDREQAMDRARAESDWHAERMIQEGDEQC